MYVISECLACVVVAFTLSAILFAFCVMILAIKQGIESWRDTLRTFQKVGTISWAQPAVAVARHKEFDR